MVNISFKRKEEIEEILKEITAEIFFQEMMKYISLYTENVCLVNLEQHK